MKIRTSISMSEKMVKELDKLVKKYKYFSRSKFIEDLLIKKFRLTRVNLKNNEHS